MKQSQTGIQRVELNCYDNPIYCPFCGAVAFETDSGKHESMKPCGHVLFLAHDEGFEYRSDRFDAAMDIVGTPDEAIDLGDGGYDGFTNRVSIKDSVKFAIYIPAPSFFGAYVGFAPTAE
ncbi:MAG: hypothetical protein KDM63_10695 [Verrucomicrobiae bacterium]|nr:hypothetical protein [Verrucomicrobiae bacterium]